MILKRILLATLMFSLGLAGNAQAAQYSLAQGSGAQLHIGGGLALPIQAAATVVGGAFPPLLIGLANNQHGGIVTGTTVMTVGQRITVAADSLSHAAAPATVGVFTSNPTLYAVGTDLKYTWPTAPAVFSENGRAGAATLTILDAGGVAGNNIQYSPRAGTGGKRFGGAGTFALSAGNKVGFVPGSPITIYAIAVPGAGNPPCVHTALTPVPFAGPGSPACVAALIAALPSGVAAIGQLAGATVMTPGGIPGGPGGGPIPGIGVLKAGALPALGNIDFFTFTPLGTMQGPTNMATSVGFPFTTGKIVIAATAAMGAPETFTISGNDTRTAGGAGTIQMVAGALSARPLSGNNANRGWLRLVLVPLSSVPAMSPIAQGIAVLLLLMVPVVYFGRRARSSQAV